MIILEKTEEKEKQLIVENIIKLAKFARISNLIDFNGKYI